MRYLQTYQVFPKIPESLSFLEELARNYWWCWQKDAVELFRRIDPRLWEDSGRNPILFSTRVPQERFEELAGDASFLAAQEKVRERFERRVRTPLDPEGTSFRSHRAIAYFSMEFGIHESLPIYAGGLGMLAGDHLKAASNLGIPMIGVGLLYRQGYFHQYLDQNGWQQESYADLDLYQIPVERAVDTAGREVRVCVDGPDGEIQAAVWRINIGRIPLFLLDTNLAENPPAVREITGRLYASEGNIRLSQEILLGIGGMRALAAMGIEPQVIHINEGHAAFVSLERIAQIMGQHQIDTKTALQIVARTTVFTTHTPVAAGYDEFPPELVRPCLKPYVKRFGMPEEDILAWGQAAGAGKDAALSMFVLALQMAQFKNGVSELHGRVARGMWAHVWPQRPVEEVPISHITNGIHIASWISSEMSQLFENYLGPDWYLPPRSADLSRRIDEIYDEELWHAHEMSRTRLIRTCRDCMVKQYGRRNAPLELMRDLESVLDPDVLTIGFARRFASYKRAYLLFQNPQQLEAMMTNEKKPVQFIFAGKAHPRDSEGKGLIKRIIDFAGKTCCRHRIVFIENYDPHIARHLVQGADIWLNTPRRPLEACGTSGMKAAVNGCLNFSTLDGWWNEGCAPETGWCIGDGEEYTDPAYQDAVESQALYNILENEVIPLFYDRVNGGVPARWIQKMKASIKMAFNRFSAQGMLCKYVDRFYEPAARNYNELAVENPNKARRLVAQYEKLCQAWSEIRVARPVRNAKGPFRVGEGFTVVSEVQLGRLRPDEVVVELYYGPVQSVEALAAGDTQPMRVKEDRGGGTYIYECDVRCRIAGRYGFTARVLPNGDAWLQTQPSLIAWAA